MPEAAPHICFNSQISEIWSAEIAASDSWKLIDVTKIIISQELSTYRQTVKSIEMLRGHSQRTSVDREGRGV